MMSLIKENKGKVRCSGKASDQLRAKNSFWSCCGPFLEK
jgi:hypothetical protein